MNRGMLKVVVYFDLKLVDGCGHHCWFISFVRMDMVELHFFPSWLLELVYI